MKTDTPDLIMKVVTGAHVHGSCDREGGAVWRPNQENARMPQEHFTVPYRFLFCSSYMKRLLHTFVVRTVSAFP